MRFSWAIDMRLSEKRFPWGMVGESDFNMRRQEELANRKRHKPPLYNITTNSIDFFESPISRRESHLEIFKS